MRRLASTRLRPWARDYLVYRHLWPALQQALARALHGRPTQGLTVLDLGCGERPYAAWFGDATVIGIDRDQCAARADVIADATRLPLADASVDVVFCAQVIEHVDAPQRMLAECHRVLAPAGHLVLSGPFWWPLHEEPHDYYRFTEHGLRALLAEAGFARIQIEADSASLTQLALAVIELLPRWAALLVPLINLTVPFAQRLSRDRRSPVNLVALAQKA